MAESRGVSVRELLATHDSHELAEWAAYYSLYPEPQERADLRAGNVAATMHNAWRDGNTQSAAQPADYVYKVPETLEDIDGETQEDRTARSMSAMSAMR